MLRDSFILCLLAGAAGFIFVLSLPSGKLIELQTLIAAFFAFIAAVLAYIGMINSVHEKHRLEQTTNEEKERTMELKRIFFMQNDVKILLMKMGTFLQALESAENNPKEIRANITAIKREDKTPPSLSWEYKEYFFLEEDSLTALASVFWSKAMVDKLLEDYDDLDDGSQRWTISCSEGLKVNMYLLTERLKKFLDAIDKEEPLRL